MTKAKIISFQEYQRMTAAVKFQKSQSIDKGLFDIDQEHEEFDLVHAKQTFTGNPDTMKVKGKPTVKIKYLVLDETVECFGFYNANVEIEFIVLKGDKVDYIGDEITLDFEPLELEHGLLRFNKPSSDLAREAGKGEAYDETLDAAKDGVVPGAAFGGGGGRRRVSVEDDEAERWRGSCNKSFSC